MKRDASGLIVFKDPRGAPIANAPPPLPAPKGTALATAEMVMPRHATMDYHYVVNSLVRG
ncbi:MAG: hypothetical protein IT381_19465 [Deltaproteobacteria bacterium]|nr:hypothetical protein [Deltaproteobacteria bacterium]